MKLIREFTEFTLQRFDSDPTAQVKASDPSLSQGAFDTHIANVVSNTVRLNDIMNQIKSTNNIYLHSKGKIVDGLDVKNLKIQRMFPSSSNVDVDVYISFEFQGKEYFGVIKNLKNNPQFTSELFKNTNLFTNKEWFIKIKGLIIKTIKQWLVIPPNTEWKALKEITCVDRQDGNLVIINENDVVEVLRTLDDKIIIKIEDFICELRDKNFFYFNYWFERV